MSTPLRYHHHRPCGGRNDNSRSNNTNPTAATTRDAADQRQHQNRSPTYYYSSSPPGGPMCNNNSSKRRREDNHAGAAGDFSQRQWNSNNSIEIYCPQGYQQQQQQMPRHHPHPQQYYDAPAATPLHKKARRSSWEPPLNNGPAEQRYYHHRRRYHSSSPPQPPPLPLPPPHHWAGGNHTSGWNAQQQPPSPQRSSPPQQTPPMGTTAAESIRQSGSFGGVGVGAGRPGGPQSPRQRRRPSRWGCRVNPELHSIPKVAADSGGNVVQNSAPSGPPPSFNLCDDVKNNNNNNCYKTTSSEYTVETADLTYSPAVSTLDQTYEASVAGTAQDYHVVSGSLQSNGGGSSNNSLALNNKVASPTAPHQPYPALPTNVVVLRQVIKSSSETQRQPEGQQQQQEPKQQLSLDDRIPRKQNSAMRDVEDEEELLTPSTVADMAAELSSSGALPDPSRKSKPPQHVSLPVLRKPSPKTKCAPKPKLDRTDDTGSSYSSSEEEEFEDTSEVRPSRLKSDSRAKRIKKKIARRRRSLSSGKQRRAALFDTDSDDEDDYLSPPANERCGSSKKKPSAPPRALSSRKPTAKKAPKKQRTNLRKKPSQCLFDTDEDEEECEEEAFLESDDDNDDSSDSSSSSSSSSDEDDDSEEESTDDDASVNEKKTSSKKSNNNNRSNSATSGNENNNSGIPDCDDPSLVKVGARVEVYWEEEGEYFRGIVSQYAPSNRNSKPFFVLYSDGDSEWINFEQERFRLLSTPPERERPVGPSKEIAPKAELTVIDKPGDNTFQASAVCEKPRKIAKAPSALDASRVDNVPQKSEKKISPIATTSAEKSTDRKKDAVANTGTEKELEPEDNIASLPADQRNEAETRKAEPAIDNVSTEPLGWVAAGISKDDDSSDDSETDEEELNQFAAKMFGIPVPPASPRKEAKKPQEKIEPLNSASNVDLESEWAAIYEVAGEPLPLSISEKVKLAKRKASATAFSSSGDNAGALAFPLAFPPAIKARKKSTKKFRITMRANAQAEAKAAATARVVEAKRHKQGKAQEEAAAAAETTTSNSTIAAAPALAEDEEETKRRKEEARPLTAEQIKAIQEDCLASCSTSWVRRSVRQPSKSALNAPLVKSLLEKLRSNDSDMVVLKMKKYCSDSDTPQLVIDAVLDALEENQNCESLYIQNFNEGMRDEQVLHLLRVLQRPSCKIWCLNIGETYKVKMETWEMFADGLKDTKISHLYVSEHTITTELKDQLRSTIRENRKKHNMHCDPNNLDTIAQCTHCWWNPINAKVLRPYVKRRGYEHILHDAEVQGLPGTHSGANLL